MSRAVGLVAWVLALAVVSAPHVGLPRPDLGADDRFGLVACLALVAASTPRARPRPSTPPPAAAALALLAAFAPIGAVALELDAQVGRERPAVFTALVLAAAAALAWSAERARRDARRALLHGGGWLLLLGLPAVAATLFSAPGSLAWCPLVWCLGPYEPRSALAAAVPVALLVGLAGVRIAERPAPGAA